MPINYQDEDWGFTSYPFPHSQIQYHPSAAEAFAGSKAGHDKDCHYLHGMVSGHPPQVLATMATSEEPVPGGHARPDTAMAQVGLSERAIRTKLSAWRKTVCAKPEYLLHIFERALLSIDLGQKLLPYVSDGMRFTLSFGLFDGMQETERVERESIWNRGQECTDSCPSALTRDEIIRDYNGITNYNAELTSWRMALGEDQSEKFRDWAKRRMGTINEKFVKLDARASRKLECRSCKFRGQQFLSNRGWEDVTYYLSLYRIADAESFFRLFVFGLLLHLQRMHIYELVQAMERYRRNVPVMSRAELAAYDKFKYQIDDDHNHLVNSISWAIIDCLLAEKSGDMSMLQRPYLAADVTDFTD